MSKPPTSASDARIDANPPQSWFATTHWSVVLTARDGDASEVRDALARLCESYWYPLYAYLRKRGFSPHDAEDLTQSFLVYLLGKDFLANVSPQYGKFRSFLLASLNHFVSDQRDKEQRQKRGGGRRLLSLDVDGAEARYRLEPVEEADPQRIFERRWAFTVVESALQRLETESVAAGKEALFAGLKSALIGDPSSKTYSELGQSLGLSEGALKVAVHRLRRRFRELFRQEIVQTVSQPDEVEDEIRFLFRVLSR